MADERDLAAEAALAAAARHALHDEELVAAYAANGLESSQEAAQASALVARCTVCRDLHRDLAAIGTALAAAATFTTRAPRDFRLTVDDAHRLGGRVMARGFLASLRRSLEGWAKPVGATLTAFGLIGVLVGTAALGSGGASAPFNASSAATNAPAEVQAGDTEAGPKASTTGVAYGPMATDDGTRAGADGGRDLGTAGRNPIVWLLGGSLSVLLVGIGLLVLAIRRGRSGAPRP